MQPWMPLNGACGSVGYYLAVVSAGGVDSCETQETIPLPENHTRHIKSVDINGSSIAAKRSPLSDVGLWC